jgi:hypothetical protein
MQEGSHFLVSASFGGAMEGCIYKLGPCGLGYYRDDDAKDNTEVSNVKQPEQESSMAFTETVEVFGTAEEALGKAVEFYKAIRVADGRQKVAVVVIADGDKPISRLPPKFGIPQVLLDADHEHIN